MKKGFTVGKFLLFLSFIVMFLVLLSKSPSPMERGILVIICFIFMCVGIVLDTDLIEHIREGREDNDNSDYR